MGCAETKSITNEEQALIEAEKCLGFELKSAKEVDSVMRKYSSNGYINESQLQKISEILEINIVNTGSNGHIQDFFKKLRNKSDLYQLKDLLIIGILLSDGETTEKSQLIYEAFDEDLSNNMDLYLVKEKIFKTLIYHSAVSLPRLLTSEQLTGTTMLKVQKYLETIVSTTNICISKTANLFGLRNLITQDTFIDIFAKILNGSLTTTTGWRRYMSDTYIIEPPRKSFEKPFIKQEAY